MLMYTHGLAELYLAVMWVSICVGEGASFEVFPDRLPWPPRVPTYPEASEVITLSHFTFIEQHVCLLLNTYTCNTN